MSSPAGRAQHCLWVGVCATSCENSFVSKRTSRYWTNIIWSVWRWSVRNIWIHLFWSFHQLSGLQPKQIFDADQQATGHHSCARSLCMVAGFKFQNNSWIKRFREIGGNFTTLPQLFKQHGYHSIIAGKIFHRYKLLMSKLQNSMPVKTRPEIFTSCKSKIATNVSGWLLQFTC